VINSFNVVETAQELPPYFASGSGRNKVPSTLNHDNVVKLKKYKAAKKAKEVETNAWPRKRSWNQE